jgi:putative hydrolase of HD superfamily
VSRAQLLLEALLLKELPRSGWLRVPIDAPESVAAHSWGVAWLAVLLCPDTLDRERVMTIAIVHDVPEVRAGDITPHDGISRKEKKRRELEAATALFAGEERLMEAWQEYEDNQTPEAQFVHQLDKLDMALQAVRYTRSRGADTTEFVESARAKIPKKLWALLESA